MPARTKPGPEPQRARRPLQNGAALEVLTLAEAAAYLRLPEPDVLRMVREQHLHARQVGSEWRFLKPAIDEWLGTGPQTFSNKEAWDRLMEYVREHPLTDGDALRQAIERDREFLEREIRQRERR